MWGLGQGPKQVWAAAQLRIFKPPKRKKAISVSTQTMPSVRIGNGRFPALCFPRFLLQIKTRPSRLM